MNDIINSRKDLFCIALVFCYVFCFKVISIVDSSICIGGILFLLFLYKKGYRKSVDLVFLSKGSQNILIVVFFICLWILLTQILNICVNSTYDLSFFKTFFHLILQILIGFALYGYLLYSNCTFKIVDYIVISFIIQTLFEWLGFIFPWFADFTSIFKSDDTLELYNAVRYRGVGIANSTAFGLASCYSVVYILFFTDYNHILRGKVVKKSIIFVFLLTGTFFAGRTGYIGLGFALLYYFFKFLMKRNKALNGKKLFFFLCSICIFLLFVYLVLSFKDEAVFSSLYDFAFEPFLNYFNGNGFSTASTDVLFTMYDVKIDGWTILFGDGLYTNPVDGLYYQHTDVGYLRPILYFGVFGLVLLFILQYYILMPKGKKTLERIFIFVMLCILQLKGETIGYAIMLQSLLLIFSLGTQNKRVWC